MKTVIRPADLAFAAAICFSSGLFVVGARWNARACLVIVLSCAVIVAIAKKYLWRECVICAAAFLAGILYFHLFFAWQASRVHLPPYDAKIVLLAIVTDEPTPTPKTLMLRTKAEPPFSGPLTIFAPPESDIRYGDLVQVQGKIEPPIAAYEPPAIFANNILVGDHHRGFFLREWLVNLKAAILANYEALLPVDQAALLGGIAFGSKANFDQATKNAMALSGTTHLVAISGYNITIVIFAVGGVFGRFFSRRTTFVLSILFICLFILMVGFAASGVRAAIMGFIALAAREMGETYSMRNAVSFTAVFMALPNPAILTHDMSFVLSFASLLGIVYLGPPLKKLLRQTDPGTLDWKENAVTTLSAQLAVMPVLIRIFGQFSLVAIVANILILSTVPLTMFLGVLLALFGFLSRYLAFFAAKIVGFILWYQLSMMRLFSSLAVPLPVSFNSASAMALYYAMLATFALSYHSTNDDDQKI